MLIMLMDSASLMEHLAHIYGHLPQVHRIIWYLVMRFSAIHVYMVNGSAFTPQTPPPYVGDNYYSESGNPTFTFETSIYASDPLWDGQQCEGQCCSNGKSGSVWSFPTPPGIISSAHLWNWLSYQRRHSYPAIRTIHSITATVLVQDATLHVFVS